MALLTALRFNPRAGALAIDQENWFLRRRKTFFTDNLFPLLPDSLREKGFELVYGGIGSPAFHYQVARETRNSISETYADHDALDSLCTDSRPIFTLSRAVLSSFQKVMQSRLDNRLRFLYGVSVDGIYEKGQSLPTIEQPVVRKRILDIIDGKEELGYGDLTVPNEASIIGVDPVTGFNGFTIKECDGVLSFHSCGFESLGPARYIATSHFAARLNNRSLDERRKGLGDAIGLLSLCEAHVHAGVSFGQTGGGMRLALVDADGALPSQRFRDINGNTSLMLLDIARAVLADLLHEETAVDMISALLKGEALTEIENQLFSRVEKPHLLEKLLRGYKMDTHGLPRSPNIVEALRS